MTWFKICGLRDLLSARAAADSGAHLLGFVFVEGVRRRVSPDLAADIISELRAASSENAPSIVGLFANQSVEFVNRVAGQCGLDYAQLCGDEPPDMWGRLDVPVIRQVKVREDLPRDEAVAAAIRHVAEAVDAGHVALLDKYEAGHLGGTGRVFDWDIARDIASQHRVVLAGGLTPENVTDAITVARPWGVDVSTGVETEGQKDLGKIRTFAAAVAAASPSSRQ